MTSRDLSLPRRLFIASRPISWINTAYPFGVTYYLSTGRVDGLLVLGSLFFLVPYNVVMYGVNDVFDYASDVKNPRKGGVEGALLPSQTHRAVLLVCALISLPLMLWMMLSGPWLAALILVLLMLDVVAYSAPPLRTKERPFWDSLTSSIHFVGPMVYAVVLTGSICPPASDDNSRLFSMGHCGARFWGGAGCSARPPGRTEIYCHRVRCARYGALFAGAMGYERSALVGFGFAGRVCGLGHTALHCTGGTFCGYH